MFGLRSASSAYVDIRMIGPCTGTVRRHIDTEPTLYPTTTRAIGAFSVAALVNQIAIALCRRAQAATEPDLHEQWSPELQSRR